jgi:hypothetical protein
MKPDPANETGREGTGVSCMEDQRRMEVSGRWNQNEGGMMGRW